MAGTGIDVDAGSVPVGSGQEEITRIMTMLQSNPDMLNQFNQEHAEHSTREEQKQIVVG